MSLTVYKGRTWQRLLTVTNVAGAAQDLTGATIEFNVKRHSSDPDPPIVGLTVGAGITLETQSGATLGQASLQIEGADSAVIETNLYVCAAIVTLSGDPIPHVVIVPQKIAFLDVP